MREPGPGGSLLANIHRVQEDPVSTIQMRTELPGPRSRALIERKERVVCDPIDLHVNAVIDHAEGAVITDVDGNRMIDFSSGLGCHLVGFSHPRVVEAVQAQAARFTHTDFSVVPYESYIELSERLVAKVGGERKVALFNSGAEAVENAVKFARSATGRPAIISFEGAFHGRTLMTMSLTSRNRPYKTGFGPFAPEIYKVPFSYPYRSADPERSGADALASLKRAFTTVVDPSSVAAIIFEPQQGEGGFIVPSPDFLPGVQRLAREHGILTIADEIQSGCGRTGRFLAGEHFGLDPDIVVLGKALGGGFPLSAVVGRSDVMDAPGPSAIGGTYVGNPVACAAANAVLQIIDDEGLIERADGVGKTIRARWEELSVQIPEVGDIRGLGAMIGVEMVKDRATKEPDGAFVGRLMSQTQARGLITVGCGIYHNVLRHLVPLVITDEQLDESLDVLAESAVAAHA
ncbi:MAG: 4-aminobutyrate aminotransferase / (S)-3-amino-2-methylpropionate transaminase / 5-aminovalerate [Actinomycetota bacterium]|nr:4-aminobutyrate aminotransferase / (S)-3-amino-2-methylpropionate transaminase / 5-aminovalerate [Actinomycetota bacterium]